MLKLKRWAIRPTEVLVKTERTNPDASGEPKHKPIGGEKATLEEEGQPLNDGLAARGIAVEDQDWIAFERGVAALKYVLGTDDEDFCKGILRQLEGLTPYSDRGDQTDFYFVLSVLKDAKPVDKPHAMLAVKMAICHLCAMKQAQVLLKPVRFELPADLRIALSNAGWDPARLDPQKIKVEDQTVRQGGERAFSRLMQTDATLLEAFVDYRKAKEPISASTTEIALLSDGAPTARVKAYKNGAPKSSRKLNGSRQSAAHFSGRSKQQMNSITCRKSNGRAPF
jgi:hypothetical protein